MNLTHVEARIAQLYRMNRKKKYAEDEKPPQKQCQEKDGHLNHRYADSSGLIWSCQGRSSRLATAPRSKRDEGQPLGSSTLPPSATPVRKEDEIAQGQAEGPVLEVP